jgi:hypothetical protein
MYTKYINRICPPSPSSFTFLSPQLVLTLGQDLFYFLILHFFKVCIDCLRGFHISISHIYILYFNQINLFYYFLYCPAPLLFNSFQCILLNENIRSYRSYMYLCIYFF